MDRIARYFVVVGVILVAIGGCVYLAARIGLPLGRLPGDFHFGGRNWQVYVPLTTGILVSVLLTVVLNIVARFWTR